MGLFFDIKTPEDKKLMDAYDQSVLVFRTEVAKAMEAAAAKEPSIAEPMLAAAEAMRLRPLPSEANSNTDALKRVTLSAVTLEQAFARAFALADSDDARKAIMSVPAAMRDIGKTTTSLPEFAALTQGAQQAMATLKPAVAGEMAGRTLDQHVQELKKLAVKPAPKALTPKAPKP
ncbi:MAG: hypothetical protein ACAH80_10795 [Alphaproteobacteria bacterium]